MKEVQNSLWKGADLVTVSRVLVDPYGNALAPVLVGPGIIPSTDVQEIQELNSSTRSRNAQLHLEMDESAPRKIAKHIAEKGLEGTELGHYEHVLIDVKNYSSRGMIIPPRTPLGRLHRPGEQITGEELQFLIDSDQVQAEGLILRYSNGYKKRPENLIGGTVSIDSAMRMSLPTPRKKQKLDFGDFQGDNYREKIDKQLKQIPVDINGTVLWIGNTGMEIGLPHGVDAILSRGVYLSSALRDRASYVGEHINARLLDGGKKWVIRVEVWGKAIRGLAQNFIDIDFYRGAEKPQKSNIDIKS